MATLGSLAVGTDVYDPFYNGTNKDSNNAIWRIIGQNQDGSNTTTLVCRHLGSESSRYYCNYDYQETSNPDDEIKNKGNNRYDLSNIFQWLNSTASSNWFTATHTYDVAPVFYKDTECGFLYPFSSGFKNALVSVSKPYRRYGETTTRNISGKVHLLSYSEITGQSYDGITDGTQYSLLKTNFEKSGYQYASGIMGLSGSDYTRTPLSGSQTNILSNIRRNNNGSYSYNNNIVSYAIDSGFIIVLPSSTKVSSDIYTFGDYKLYAMVNMPLHIDVDGGKSYKYVTLNGGETYNLTFKCYDEDYSISSLKISFNSDGSSPLKSMTNLQKGTEYTFTGNIRDLTKGSAKNIYFVATDSNSRTFTKTIPVTWDNAVPLVSIYHNGEWKTVNDRRAYISLGTVTKPPTLKLKFHDADDTDGVENIYGYFSNGTASWHDREPITTTPHDTEIECTASDAFWSELKDGNGYVYVIAADREITSSTGSWSGSWIEMNINKSTPAPYIDIDSTSLGRKNLGFIVNYTPKIDTIQTITNLKIYLDTTDTVLADIDNPTPDEELSYEVSKSALYDMAIGEHKLIFVVSDDLGQSSETDVTFTRYNDAPNVITESTLGDKDLGFTSNFTVQDSESDISSVNVYIDTTDSPIKTETDIATGTTIDYEVTKEMLYGLSLGEHKLLIVAADDLGSSTTEVSFTRTNDAPVISGNTTLGNINQPFTEKLTVNDTENDTVEVNFYIDTATQPFHTVSDIVGETEVEYQITREMLDNMSLTSHTIKAVATDSVGQTSTFNATFTHYNLSPSVTMTQDEVIHNGNFEVKYTVSDTDSDNVTVCFKVDNVIVVANQTVKTNEEHTQLIPVNNVGFGNRTLEVLAWDVFTQSNPSSASVNFVYNSLPIIEADAIGKVADGFTELVTVTDTDKDSVDLTVYIDDTIKIAEMSDIQHGTPLNITVNGVTFGSLAYGGHYLNIYAKDSHEQTSEKVISFEKHSKPTVSIDAGIPYEVTDAFTVTISYGNADGGEVSVKAFIDEQEIDL